MSEVEPARLRDEAREVSGSPKSWVHVVSNRVKIARLEQAEHLMEPIGTRVEIGADDTRALPRERPQLIDHQAQSAERSRGLLRGELELELIP